MPGIASSRHVGGARACRAATKTIRIGAGGIMLPNQAPSRLPSSSGTLSTFPAALTSFGRADRDQGRRRCRNMMSGAENFPQNVICLCLSRARRAVGVSVATQQKPQCRRGSWDRGAFMAHSSPRISGLASMRLRCRTFAPDSLLDEGAPVTVADFKPSAQLQQPPQQWRGFPPPPPACGSTPESSTSCHACRSFRPASGSPGRTPCHPTRISCHSFHAWRGAVDATIPFATALGRKRRSATRRLDLPHARR